MFLQHQRTFLQTGEIILTGVPWPDNRCWEVVLVLYMLIGASNPISRYRICSNYVVRYVFVRGHCSMFCRTVVDVTTLR